MLGDTLHWWDPMRGVRIRKGSKTRWGRKFHQCIQVYVLISVLFSSSPRISLVWLPEETDGSAVWCCQSNDTTGLPCRPRCTIHEKARTFFQWGISSVMASSDDLANRAHAILKLFDPQLDDGVKDVSTHQLPLRPKTLQDLLTPLVVETIEKFVYCPQYVFGTSARQFNSEAYDRVLELITMPLCTGKHRETLKSTVIEIYKTLLETSVISSPLGKNGMPTIQAQDVIDAVTEISIARMYGIPLAIYQSLLRTMKDDFEANCSPHEDEEDGSDNESLCRKGWRRLASILLAHFEKMAWYIFRTVEASNSVKGLYLRSISRLSTGRRFETLKIDWIHWASQAQDALEINHLLYLIAQFQMCHEVVAKQEDAEDEVIRAQLEEEAKKRKSRFVNFPVYTGCPVPESSHENLRGMYIHILETHGTHHLQNTPESNEGLRSSLFRVIKPPEEIEEEDTNVDEKNDSAMLKFGKKRTMHTIESKIIIGFFSTIALIIGLLVGILGVYKFFHYWLKLSGNAYAFDLYADDPHTLVELTEEDEVDHEVSIIEDRTNSSKPVHIVRPPPAKENLIVSDHRTLETDSAKKILPSEASSLSNQESEIRSSKSVGNAAEEEVEATNQPLSSEQNEGTYMIIPDSVLSHQNSLNE